jgi:hypothetical protein
MSLKPQNEEGKKMEKIRHDDIVKKRKTFLLFFIILYLFYCTFLILPTHRFSSSHSIINFFRMFLAVLLLFAYTKTATTTTSKNTEKKRDCRVFFNKMCQGIRSSCVLYALLAYLFTHSQLSSAKLNFMKITETSFYYICAMI